MWRRHQGNKKGAELIHGKGFEPIDAGELREARRTELVAHSWANLALRKLPASVVQCRFGPV